MKGWHVVLINDFDWNVTVKFYESTYTVAHDFQYRMRKNILYVARMTKDPAENDL